jgi:hypothetical protein
VKFGVSKVVFLGTIFALVFSAPAFATTLYTQSFDQTGALYASQNDVGGLGNFASTYDDFTVNNANYTINEIQWTGGYFNGSPGSITGWTINIYLDSAGQPGTQQYSTHISGNGNETFLGNFGGTPSYTYDVAGLNFAELSGVKYWLSVVPDITFPPQWGWETSAQGNGVSDQDFLGSRSQLGADEAFTLSGTVPEPGTLVMLGTGVLGLAGAIRRKLF